mgnify:CR=1 FL=1
MSDDELEPPLLLRYRGNQVDYDWLWENRNTNPRYQEFAWKIFFSPEFDPTTLRLYNETKQDVLHRRKRAEELYKQYAEKVILEIMKNRPLDEPMMAPLISEFLPLPDRPPFQMIRKASPKSRKQSRR